MGRTAHCGRGRLREGFRPMLLQILLLAGALLSLAGMLGALVALARVRG